MKTQILEEASIYYLRWFQTTVPATINSDSHLMTVLNHEHKVMWVDYCSVIFQTKYLKKRGLKSIPYPSQTHSLVILVLLIGNWHNCRQILSLAQDQSLSLRASWRFVSQVSSLNKLVKTTTSLILITLPDSQDLVYWLFDSSKLEKSQISHLQKTLGNSLSIQSIDYYFLSWKLDWGSTFKGFLVSILAFSFFSKLFSSSKYCSKHVVARHTKCAYAK